MSKTAYLLVNFGGPRDLNEVEEFLVSLLTDQEVIRTSFPAFIHRLLFTWVAKKRTKKVTPDYAFIGGKSPIFEDTEAIAQSIREKLNAKVLTFHRYLPKTHAEFIDQIQRLDAEEIRVMPLFPQFSYATTGSIALWFAEHFSSNTLNKMNWVKSYASHPAYMKAFANCLREFMQGKGLKEEETVLLFSAHGLPQRFIYTGDPYQRECELSFHLLKSHFPQAHSLLCYQSQFGKEEWIRPYTNQICREMAKWGEGRKQVVVIPLSFTSDHIETLYEIEQLYLPLIREQGLEAYRCPALNRRTDWLDAITQILVNQEGLMNQMLIRVKK
jgi:ferrochelatase